MKEHVATHDIGRMAVCSIGREIDHRRSVKSNFTSPVLRYELLSRRKDHRSALRPSELAELFARSAYAD
jgi:hypothetical protein